MITDPIGIHLVVLCTKKLIFHYRKYTANLDKPTVIPICSNLQPDKYQIWHSFAIHGKKSEKKVLLMFYLAFTAVPQTILKLTFCTYFAQSAKNASD